MTALKQILLGAAVAGVVAGTGSAVATAVAYADPAGTDDTSSSARANAGDASGQDGTPTRSRGTAHASTQNGTSGPQTGSRGRVVNSRDAVDAADAAPPRLATHDQDAGDSPLSTTTAPAARNTLPDESAAAVPAAPTLPAAAVAVTDAGSPVAPNPVAAPAPAAVAPVQVSPPIVSVEVSPVVAAAAVLAPAPAAPVPALPLLPLLPTIPVAPVTPASAATVSATSGTNTRVRAASAVAQAAVLADPPTHVLLIGTDGTNLNKILQYTWDNPSSTGFQQLMEDGTTAATSIVGHTTISGPSWSTILTGVWDNKTGVINNLFSPTPYTDWPTVFNMLEAYNPNIDTGIVADWKFVNDVAAAGGFPADTNIYFNPADFDEVWADADQAVTDKTVALINGTKADDPTFLFSYQVQVDEAGHDFGGASAEYKQAVINVGDNISEIMQAVHASEASGVDWTVIVTTDHGHQQSVGFGHGFQTPNETSSFIVFDQAGNHSGGLQNQSYSNVDITPTIVNLFGAPLRSDFDGVPMTTKNTGIADPVDLKTSLNNAVSAYGYPNIGTDVALSVRTVVATVPYLINNLVNSMTGFLQGIVDKDIFLISGLAGFTQWIVQFNGDLAVGVTQAVAKGVAWLTGSGTIAPTDPPLTANEDLPLSAAVLLT